MSSKNQGKSRKGNGSSNHGKPQASQASQSAKPQAQPTQLPAAPAVNPFAIQTILISEMLPDGMPITLPDANDGTTVQGETVTTSAPPVRTRARGAERNSYPIGAEEFAVTYNSSKNLEEVSQRLKMPIAAVASRAQYYKSVGISDGKGGKVQIDLKSFRGSPRSRIDAHALNAKLAELAKQLLAQPAN